MSAIEASTFTIMGWSRVEAWFYLRLMTTVPPVVMSTLRHKPASVHRKKQSIPVYTYSLHFTYIYMTICTYILDTHAHTRTHLQWIFCIVGNNKHSSINSRICINHKLNQTFSFRLLGSSLHSSVWVYTLPKNSWLVCEQQVKNLIYTYHPNNESTSLGKMKIIDWNRTVAGNM